MREFRVRVERILSIAGGRAGAGFAFFGGVRREGLRGSPGWPRGRRMNGATEAGGEMTPRERTLPGGVQRRARAPVDRVSRTYPESRSSKRARDRLDSRSVDARGRAGPVKGSTEFDGRTVTRETGFRAAFSGARGHRSILTDESIQRIAPRSARATAATPPLSY
jgi:hypothetical protein